MDLESSPASLKTTHSYTAVSSTVGAITIREPDDSNLEKKKKMSVSQGLVTVSSQAKETTYIVFDFKTVNCVTKLVYVE